MCDELTPAIFEFFDHGLHTLAFEPKRVFRRCNSCPVNSLNSQLTPERSSIQRAFRALQKVNLI